MLIPSLLCARPRDFTVSEASVNMASNMLVDFVPFRKCSMERYSVLPSTTLQRKVMDGHRRFTGNGGTIVLLYEPKSPAILLLVFPT